MVHKVLLTIYRDERGGMQGALGNTADIFAGLGWQPHALSLYKSGHESGLTIPSTWISNDETVGVEMEHLRAVIDDLAPDLIINFSCPYIHSLDMGYPIIERVAMLSCYSPDPVHRIVSDSLHLTGIAGQTLVLTHILSGLAIERRLPVHWIPNFVVEPTANTSLARLDSLPDGFCPDGFKVINISRNHPQKNLDALCDVACACPGANFLLVTNTPLADAPPNMQVFVGLSESNISALLEQSDLYINLAHKEGISNATLRAFAHGLPAILTDGDGITCHLAGNAWVADTFALMPQNTRYARNILQIAQWIRQLAADQDLRCHMGQRSREVAAQFNRPSVSNRWQELIKEALS